MVAFISAISTPFTDMVRINSSFTCSGSSPPVSSPHRLKTYRNRFVKSSVLVRAPFSSSSHRDLLKALKA